MLSPFIHVSDYNKISDTIMYLGKNVVLKFNVYLNYENEKYGQQNFHKEYCYYNNRLGKDQYTIMRYFDYAMTIENTSQSADNDIREVIQIGVCEMSMMKMLLHAGMEWFTNPQYSELYSNKDGKLVMMEQVQPRRIFCRSKYIEIEPIVYVDSNLTYDFGIRMYLNSETNYVEMSLSRYCGLHYMMDTINLYQAAITLINYLERPEFGTNLTSFSNNYNSDGTKEQKIPVQKTGRKPINVFAEKRNLEDSL